MQVHPRKAFFKRASAGIVLGCALTGTRLGDSPEGSLGALLGLAVGIAGGGQFVETHRFDRC